MNYYNEIKETLIKNEIYKKVKDYSKNKSDLNAYFEVGRLIVEAQGGEARAKYGNKLIKEYSLKLTKELGKGYSIRNLALMRKFYIKFKNVQTVSAQIPWSHNVAILDKVKNQEERIWYIQKATENGWSHSVLVHQIESGLYQRQALANKVSNFERRLPSPQSELAVQTMKDPYIFDFIPFKEDMVERDIEQALVRDVTKLLLELGTGFAFLGTKIAGQTGCRRNAQICCRSIERRRYHFRRTGFRKND